MQAKQKKYYRNRVGSSIYICLIVLATSVFGCFQTNGQERLGPVRYNPKLKSNVHSGHSTARKTSALSLPFFEDFTGYSPLPDSNLWVDREVLINNTFGVRPVSRGVATMDNLNSIGMPYDTTSNSAYLYADSLTSQPINLDFSTVTPYDSVYLSFFYQAQGNGYYPLPPDSLMLFFKNVFGDYVKVWAIPGPDTGVGIQPFAQIMVPVTDSLFFHGQFQFRFVNISSTDWAGSDWNLDYIRLSSNRFIEDTLVNDVAISANPSFLLNDYTSMPYSQFMANITGELAGNLSDSLVNDSSLAQNINHTFVIYDTTGGVNNTLFPAVSNNTLLPSFQTAQVTEPFTIAASAFPSYPANTTVTFERECYLRNTPFTGGTQNDTIALPQVFSNYLAYDDGSAEQAYYLLLNTSEAIPGEIELEFHLNHPDTLRGLAIYFARQIPPAEYKEFFIRIYYSLINVNGYYTDSLLREQEYNYPGYIDTVNHFWNYKLDTPLVLPAGTFYAGTVQPAYSNSDSLYFGFDVNRVGGNHAYFRVEGAGAAWSPSLLSGSIMIRPILGSDITASEVRKVNQETNIGNIRPNPAHNRFSIYAAREDGYSAYEVTDMTGRMMLHGTTVNGKDIDIEPLANGIYFVHITSADGRIKSIEKLIKN